MRILIADDDPISRLILQRAIGKLEHECIVAEDGTQAWELFQRHEPDVVISDWMMPGMDGVELCRRVRGSAREAYPYFVFLTALADREHLFTSLEAGADDLLSKPLDRSELRMRLLAAARVTSLYRQIAEQKAEQELQHAAAESARRDLRAVLDATSEGFVLITPDRRVRMCNRRFAELFGLDRAACVGRSVDDLRPAFALVFDDPAGLESLPSSDGAGSAVGQTRVVAQHWPERRELALFTTEVLGRREATLGRLYVFRDVTREREVDRMKSEFVSLVSHELRTPLTSIKGYVALMLGDEVGPLSEEQREFLGIVSSNADRLSNLVSDFLDLSKIEAGKIDLSLDKVDVSRLATDVAESLRPQIEAKRQRIVLELDDGMPEIEGDSARLAQVLTNLVSNAHKYTPAGGTITIVTTQEPRRMRIDVRDTGIGLSTEDLAKLFQKFFRAKRPETQAIGGTGLGLAITRALVELHGGAIAVTSTLGQGSVFSVVLPRADVPEALANAAIPIAAPAIA